MQRETQHVLIVEEDPTLAEVTAFRLELLGYNVETARTASDALHRVIDALPDVIIADLALPGMDGFELIERLSNDPRTANVPVLAFSTDANLDNVQRAFATGAKDYLVTPYDPTVLEHKLEKLLDASIQV